MPGRSIGWDLHTPDDPADEPSHWQRYGFDGAGRLNAVSSPAGEYSYTYVEQSHLLASVTGPVHTVTNSYESGRDAMTSKTNAAASGTVSRFGAKYDALGRRVEVNRSGSAFAQNFVSGYQYDLLGQLTSDARFEGSTPGAPDQKLEEESFSFLYDGIGNRLTAQKGNDTTAYTPNALNQYTSIDGIEPVYDADGNLFSDGKNRFHWDAENRLILVEPLVPTEGSKRLEFNYDYIGRRVSKQVWTHTSGSWTDESTTAFVYDGWNLIEEITTSSQTASINHYTWGIDLSGSLQGAGGVGGLLSQIHTDSNGTQTFHYTFDLNGNVSELLDSTGSIAAHYEYGPFGEMLRETYPSSALSEVERSLLTFNFSTKYYDAELKTLYYGYRYYDPTNGRWLNRDPIAEQGGLNLYGFVGNDSVNRWDLLGMQNNIDVLRSFVSPSDIAFAQIPYVDQSPLFVGAEEISVCVDDGDYELGEFLKKASLSVGTNVFNEQSDIKAIKTWVSDFGINAKCKVTTVNGKKYISVKSSTFKATSGIKAGRYGILNEKVAGLVNATDARFNPATIKVVFISSLAVNVIQEIIYQNGMIDFGVEVAVDFGISTLSSGAGWLATVACVKGFGGFGTYTSPGVGTAIGIAVGLVVGVAIDLTLSETIKSYLKDKINEVYDEVFEDDSDDRMLLLLDAVWDSETDGFR